MSVLIDAARDNIVPQDMKISRESHYKVKYTPLAFQGLRFPTMAQHPLLGHDPLTVKVLQSH